MDEVTFDHRLTEVEQRSKSNTHRINELAEWQKAMNELATSVALMTREQKDMRDDLSEVKKDVKSLTNLPAKRWNDVVEKLVWLVLGGAVVVEQIFSLPGLGQMTLTGINNRDYPVVQGCVLFIAFIYVLVNLVVDLLYAYIDPRISYD